MTANYPLEWPAGWPRTRDAERRHNSAFKVTAETARRELLRELGLLGAKNVIVSSNVAIRQDGQPYADIARRVIRDPGVAVYFMLNGQQMVMARDAFLTVAHNIRSIGLAVEAIRAIERHGGSHMMKTAFSGFAALPPPRRWWDILGVAADAQPDEIERAFRAKARQAHPDAGGSDAAMAELNAARADALGGRA